MKKTAVKKIINKKKVEEVTRCSNSSYSKKSNNQLVKKCHEKYYQALDDWFSVESVEDKRIKDGKPQYLCTLRVDGTLDSGWVPLSELYGSLDRVKKYEDKQLYQKLQPPVEAVSALFDQGWEAVAVLGVMFDKKYEKNSDGKTQYMVELRHQVRNEVTEKVLVPDECGKGRNAVESLVEEFNNSHQITKV